MCNSTCMPSYRPGLVSVAVVFLVVLLNASRDAISQDSVSSNTLSHLREIALTNETKCTLLRMQFRFSDTVSGDDPKVLLFKPSDSEKDRYVECVFAQDGKRRHRTNALHVGTECPLSHVDVVNGEVRKGATLPDWMFGWIDPPESFDEEWGGIPPMRTFRPFTNRYLLSECLVDKYASVLSEHATSSGRNAAIVRVVNPDNKEYYDLMWIDIERGVLLRQEIYAPSEDIGEHRRVEVHEAAKWHQLPNGGWIPIEGDIKQHQIRKGLVFDYAQHWTVDVNSISIDKKDIPDSLFDIEFPPGTIIQNHIVGRK